jgi:hypothetical protein
MPRKPRADAFRQFNVRLPLSIIAALDAEVAAAAEARPARVFTRSDLIREVLYAHVAAAAKAAPPPKRGK